jgi:LuxR family maltose regulon positive regulatory protein
LTAATRPEASLGPVLVATKLHAPEPRPGLVPRRELLASLVVSRDRKLTLVCAPAGWGKTTLLSESYASPEEERPFAWVSLDPSDDDPVRFWSYVRGALRIVEPDLGGAALAALPDVGPDPVDAVLPPLLNDLAGLQQRLVLVLDDYHFVHNALIHASVSFLLRHLPATMHVALGTRADPPLPLGGMRASGQIREIRTAELRFSDVEADALLNGSLGLALARTDVESLRARTEGWAAGLQLAALSVRAHEDKHEIVEAFAGVDRQIGDYLHEVLAEQPRGLRDFLLRTSILERMCAPLCDAVTAQGDGARQLAAAERSNLFLIALDTQGSWYRYHHLFRDLLRHELARSAPRSAEELHRRAAAWHREQGDVDEAIAHAVAAKDFEDAGELIAEHWRRIVFHLGQVETAARGLDRLPPESVMSDPRLCLARGWIGLVAGRHDEVRECLRAAESSPPAPGPLHAVASSIESALAQLRTSHALLSGDVGRAIEAGRRALALEPDRASLAHAVANINLGAALYFAGDLAAAEAALTAGLPRLLEQGWRTAAVIAGLGYSAMIHVDTDRIVEAERIATEAEDLIESWQRGEGAWAAPAVLASGRVLEWRGDLGGAEAKIARAVVLARRGSRRLDLAHALILLARLRRRRRDHSEARSLGREAHRVLDTCLDPGVLGDLLRKTERALQLAPSRRAETALPVDAELSERELTVLRLLASELSQREIGSKLYVSLNTVKGHVRSIFRKLGVATRAEAVARGRELGLI